MKIMAIQSILAKNLSISTVFNLGETTILTNKKPSNKQLLSSKIAIFRYKVKDRTVGW